MKERIKDKLICKEVIIGTPICITLAIIGVPILAIIGMIIGYYIYSFINSIKTPNKGQKVAF
jgi:hypothetical protein